MDASPPSQVRPDTLLQIRPGLAWEQFPDEVVAIDLDRLLYFNLTNGGAEFFRCFASPTTVERVAAHLTPAFEVPAEELARHALRLATELVAADLFVIAPASAAPDVALPAVKAASCPSSDLTLHAHGDLQNLLYLDPVHDSSEAGWPVPEP